MWGFSSSVELFVAFYMMRLRENISSFEFAAFEMF